jgi:hypothetical protein
VQEWAPSAPGEEDEAFVSLEESLQREGRGVASAPPMGVGKQTAEIRVPSGGLREDRKVPQTRRIVRPGRAEKGARRELDFRKTALSHGDLGAGDRLDLRITRCSRELHAAVEAVMIGQRERGIAQLLSPEDQLFGVRGPIQEGVARMSVELDVRGSRARAARRIHIPKIHRKVWARK